MSGRTSGKHRLTGAKIALKVAKATNLKGSQGIWSIKPITIRMYTVYKLYLNWWNDLRALQVWDTSRGVSQIVWTQSPRLEQTKENKWHVYPRSKLLNKSAPSTQHGAPAFSTRGTSQRILTHIAGFFLFKRHFSTNNLIDDHGVRKNVHLRQGRTFQHISQKDLSPPSVSFSGVWSEVTLVTLVTSILPKFSPNFASP